MQACQKGKERVAEKRNERLDMFSIDNNETGKADKIVETIIYIFGG